jgi:hypothetical protein
MMKELRGIHEKEERKDEGRWYGFTSTGRYMEKLKGIMRREGIRMYRKGGEKLERKMKERLRKEKEDGVKKGRGKGGVQGKM